MRFTLVFKSVLFLWILIFHSLSAQTITEIIDQSGDGINVLVTPRSIVLSNSGNVYLTGQISSNAFKITSSGIITEIIDNGGDASGNSLTGARGITVDNSENVYVTGIISDNAFKITPSGIITEIIDATGDGAGNTLNQAFGVISDNSGNIYVTGVVSDNAFKITPSGVITEIIDATGDGSGNILDEPRGITIDDLDNVYVVGNLSDNAFKITSSGMITEIIDATGDGSGNILNGPVRISADASENIYISGAESDNAFVIEPIGTITEIIDITGDGLGNPLEFTLDISLDDSGNVYLTGSESNNAFKIEAPLPVDLIKFCGETINQHNYLKWETASETNNLGFEIQRSKDVNSWKKIGFVYGKGTTNKQHNYQFIDKSQSSEIFYYRLKQMDYDGDYEYSKIVSLASSKKEIFKIVPNPTKGIIEIRGIKTGKIKLITNNGIVVRDEQLNDSKKIDISYFPRGIYLISVETEGKIVTKKVIKTN